MTSYRIASSLHTVIGLPAKYEKDSRLMATYNPCPRQNAGQNRRIHSTICAANFKLSFGFAGSAATRRRMNDAKLPPNAMRKLVMIIIRLQMLGLENRNENSYEKDAAAGPNKTRRVKTPPKVPPSLVVMMSMEKMNMSATVIQHGIW